MVRALLDGTKTQTRRVVKPTPEWTGQSGVLSYRGRVGLPHALCPYGQPGDRLWVRESFSPYEHREGCWYWADGNIAAHDCTKPKPSIHMHRFFSRITLEITEVRVERLRDISPEDCWAEGIQEMRDAGDENGELRGSVKQDYQALWESINGPGSWAANPWVWVVEFKRLEQPA
jgi:hypothetical protein